MFKKHLLMVSLGVSFVLSQAHAEDYPNKYNSPKKAHDLYIKARQAPLNSPEMFKAYADAKKAGSVDAILWSANIFFDGADGAESFKQGLEIIKPVLNKNLSEINKYAIIGYAWTGDQKSARKYLDLELAKPNTEKAHFKQKAHFEWDYARYTGSGLYNAPYEPKQVCDEAEAKYNAKSANSYDAYLVGRCYFDGVVRTKDELKGINIFDKHKDDIWEASDTLAILYTIGTKYTPLDYKKAQSYLGNKSVSSYVRLRELPFYASILKTTTNDWNEPYTLMQNAASYGVYEAQWIIKKYPQMLTPQKDLNKVNMLTVIRQNPESNPNLPKGSPRFPEYYFVTPKNVLDKDGMAKSEMTNLMNTSPRLLQAIAYLKSDKLLANDMTDYEGCLQAQKAYEFGKFDDEHDDIYESSGDSYAVCLAKSKSFRSIHKNPTQMGYRVVEDLMNRNYPRGFTLKILYDQEFKK